MKKKRQDATRNGILQGAARVFAERGFAGATMASIAREAQVSETCIYEYFDGKEDLFLTIPKSRIENGLPLIEDHLFGIKGALAQLRKFVWVYVRQMTSEPIYTRIIMLHLKTSSNFLNSDAYKEVRKFYGRLLDIIVTGQKSGEIRPELDPHIARAVLIGTIEHIVTRWLLKNGTYDIFTHMEPAFELIEDALRAERPLHSQDETLPTPAAHRRNRQKARSNEDG
jgi:TetR/AcrR family fatty acid metabolism transcriptional regulator